jgi:hypothetical protein
MGVMSQMRQVPVDRDPVLDGRVRCVVGAIVSQLRGAPAAALEVASSATRPRTFALPAEDRRQHGPPRRAQPRPARDGDRPEVATCSRSCEQRVWLPLSQAPARAGDRGRARREQSQLLALLGLGAQVGILLPYGRDQEREADLIGLDLMAAAGFDPRESIALWQNMARAGGAEPPEFLSPSSYGTR